MIPYARLAGINSGTAFLQHTVTDEVIELEEMETLVVSQGMASDTSLIRSLDGWQGEVHVIGDALSPRTAEEAVLEGLRASMAIGA